jgi:hypothetical protein
MSRVLPEMPGLFAYALPYATFVVAEPHERGDADRSRASLVRRRRYHPVNSTMPLLAAKGHLQNVRRIPRNVDCA